MEERKVLKIKQATKLGYIYIYMGGVADLSFPNSKTRRGRVQDMGTICPTLETSSEVCRITSTRIRRLIPRESFRLMGVSERDIDKILSVVSDSQAYKQAGNSIVVNVMVEMFRNINFKRKAYE